MNKLDTKKLEEKLDLALAKETTESLTKWLKEKRELKINNMAQTSVEWLIENAEDFFGHLLAPSIIEKAKEMEKKQIIDAYNEAYYGDKYKWKGSEEYFNQTFNK